ncbi:MAG: exosortase system-associated protein, TIGR04073 family [Lentisphaeria bacterium]|nr:exosortase system-associated protein, TIGR04073 family [Lentisphaeria bacterium]
MKFGKSLLVAALVAVASFSVVPQVRADEPGIMLPVQKLGRGVANIAFGVFEIPMKWAEVNNDQGGLAGITYGTLKGVCYTVARVVVGVVDVATFLIPLPGCPNYPEDAGWGYGPIMKPAWIVPVSSDWNNFIYSNETIVNPASL